MKTVNTAFRRGIVHFCQSCHRMANSDKPQSGKFILYSSPLEFAALLRVIACLVIIQHEESALKSQYHNLIAN